MAHSHSWGDVKDYAGRVYPSICDTCGARCNHKWEKLFVPDEGLPHVVYRTLEYRKCVSCGVEDWR